MQCVSHFRKSISTIKPVHKDENIDNIKSITLVLASASPARKKTLENAGISPLIRTSSVDEESLLTHIRQQPATQVLALAKAKALDIYEKKYENSNDNSSKNTLILGCDSMFEFEGQTYGKPHTPEHARERLHKMSGTSGILHTGHALISAYTGQVIGSVSHARVHISPLTDEEIEAYIATKEPLKVAGSFTVDGIGGSFIEHIEGDYHGVVGLSLPLLRHMLQKVNIPLPLLWNTPEVSNTSTNIPHIPFLHERHKHGTHHGADGFLVCSCTKKHWGLNGAAGICPVRIHNGKPQVLLQLRAAWSHGGQSWAIPGGALNWEETPLEGALREVEEEIGIPREHFTPLPYHDNSYTTTAPHDNHGTIHVTHSYGTGTHIYEHEEWSYTTFVMQCADNEHMRLNEESVTTQWVDIDRPLPTPLHPAFAAAWPHIKHMITHSILEK
ncbi:MAG: septum formation inhibitor Maf [Actinomycetaceae bacterium]|nr:septum formation inhibitor Maf [Actinomycetaceae bacterium]